MPQISLYINPVSSTLCSSECPMNYYGYCHLFNKDLEKSWRPAQDHRCDQCAIHFPIDKEETNEEL